MLRFHVLAAAPCAALLMIAPALRADPPLTLDRALALAREQSPLARAARLRIDEARGLLAGAQPLLADNPSVSGGLGRRRSGGSFAAHSLEGNLELVQPIRLGGERAARLDGAKAAIGAETASAAATVLQIETQVALAFYRALGAGERANLGQLAEANALLSVQALERRHRLGDVPVLDVNVAKTARARASAHMRAAQAARLAAESELRRLLGLAPEAPLALAGDLYDRRRYPLDQLMARAQDRPDVRALLAEVQQAEAEAALGRAARWPTLGLGAAYARDQGDDIFLGLLEIEVPLFAHGQQQRAVGEARAQRLRLEAANTRASALIAVRAAHAVYREHDQAAQTLAEALPLALENDELAQKSYEAGQLSLADWLVVRRDTVDTRLEYITQQVAAAEAGVALAASAGVSP